jgi:hypothetical protein
MQRSHWPSSASRSTRSDLRFKSIHDQSNFIPSSWHRGGNYKRLRKQPCKRYDRRICRRAKRLRTFVGNLAIDSWSSERQTGARKRDSKYDSDNRSQHVPISKGERRRHSPRRALYGQSKYATQRSGLDCRRWTEGWSTNARHLRDHRRDPQTRLLGLARWPASKRLHVASREQTNPSILEKDGTCTFALILFTNLP